MTQLTLKRSTSDGLQARTKNRDPAVCFPGSRWTMCHIISAANGNQRASSFPQPADVWKPSAVPCAIVNPLTLAANDAARPPLRFPLMDTAFPRCSMHRPAVSFPLPVEAEFRLAEIQPRPGLEKVWILWAPLETQAPVARTRGAAAPWQLWLSNQETFLHFLNCHDACYLKNILNDHPVSCKYQAKVQWQCCHVKRCQGRPQGDRLCTLFSARCSRTTQIHIGVIWASGSHLLKPTWSSLLISRHAPELDIR